jgi:hypothetical protein
MLLDQGTELADDLAVVAQRQLDPEQVLHGCGASIVEHGGLTLDELAGHVGQRGAAPERERGAQPLGSLGVPAGLGVLPGLVHQPGELLAVQALLGDLQQVPGWPGLQHIGPGDLEQLA